MNEKLLNYFDGDEMAANVWQSKYAMEGEETPDDMHRRLAKEFARIEKRYQENEKDKTRLSEYGREREDLTIDSIYRLFKDFKHVIPQGSIMYGLGRNKPVSLSNCFFIGKPHDSYSGIMEKDQELVQLSKRRGGVGLDISSLRPKGTKVNNSAEVSTGAVSFMERYSNSTREVAQGGRRGALMITMDINHPDITDFAIIKSNLTKVTGANISIKLNDAFMKAVQNDDDYVLRFPINFEPEKNRLFDKDKLKYNKLTKLTFVEGMYKKVKAKELWETIIKQARDTAEPGILMWDNFMNYSPDTVYEDYRSEGTNPCVTGDTRILTKNGYYSIDSLVNMDVEVWNGKQFSKVTPKITGTNQEILKVKLSDGRELKCTPYHKWYLWEGFSRNGKSIIKEAKDIVIGDKIEKYNFPLIKNTGVNDDRAYSQGFYSGDGNKNSNGIWLYNDKIKLSEHLKGKKTGNIYNTPTGAKRVMFRLDFTPKHKNFVPINKYSIDSKLKWLAGILDSDGTITTDNGFQIVSVDKEFLKDIQYLLSTLGCNSKVLSTNKEGYRRLPDGKGGYKKYFCKETNRIVIGAYQVKDLINLGLKTHRIDLSNVHPNRDASRFVTVTAIEKQKKLEDFVYCFKEPIKHKGVFNGILTGQCSEINLQPYDSCRLMVLNLFSFVDNPFTKGAKINFDKLYKYSYEQQRLMDNLVDLEIESVDKIISKIEDENLDINRTELSLWKKIKKTGQNSRRTGSGITALGDMLAAIDLKYDSDKGISIVDKVFETKMRAELDCMIDLAITRGTFKGWDKNLEYEIIDNKIIKGKNKFYEHLKNTFPQQVEKMIKYGRRSVSWSTCAPTGSVSLLAQTTSGVEPLFKAFYVRRKKINSNDENSRVDFVDDNGDKWQEFAVLHPKFKKWITNHHPHYVEGDIIDLSKDTIQTIFEESPWYKSEADGIDWIKRVEIQSVIQQNVSHSISSTINLPETVTTEEVGGIYMEAWKQGLKGVTVYRDGSRSGVLISNKDKKKTDSFEYKDAPKRPKELNAESYITTVKGEKFFVIVGLMDNKPYEVFCSNGSGKVGKGKIIKEAQGNYVLQIENGHIYSRIVTSSMTDEQAGLSRMISTSLRHGANIKFVVEQLLKADGNFQSFNKAIARILKKYIVDGEKSTVKCENCGSSNVVYEEGCHKCTDCGFSACG